MNHRTVTLRRFSVLDITTIALCAALIALCSQIAIPTVVPFTMQTFGVFCTLGLLGGKRGTIAIALYLCMGAIGLPVFSGFSGGIGHLLGQTGGYLTGFLFSALLYWLITASSDNSYWRQILAMAAGLLVCYIFGTLQFAILYTRNTGAVGLTTILGWCVFPFIIPDVLKIGLALAVRRVLHPFLKRHLQSRT